MKRPQATEHHEYYGRYIEKVPDGDIIQLLESQVEETLRLLATVSPERADHRYAPGKWSIKEVVGHVIDTERTFGYRALCFARKDPAPLPSFEQDQYAEFSNAADRTLPDLAEELRMVRKSHVVLFKSFDEASWTRTGIASGFEFSVRSLPFIIAGHEIHHRTVLEDRYLPTSS